MAYELPALPADSGDSSSVPVKVFHNWIASWTVSLTGFTCKSTRRDAYEDKSNIQPLNIHISPKAPTLSKRQDSNTWRVVDVKGDNAGPRLFPTRVNVSAAALRVAQSLLSKASCTHGITMPNCCWPRAPTYNARTYWKCFLHTSLFNHILKRKK